MTNARDLDLETIPCPYCAGQRSTFWAEQNGYTAVQCDDCGFVFVNPRPSQQTRDEAVRLGVHQGENVDVNSVDRFKRARIGKIKTRLLQLFDPDELRGKRWLDIGTGFGELLLAFQQIAGPDTTAHGVEPCLPKLTKAQDLGLTAYASLNDITDTYDVVSMLNVFSHLPDPVGDITALRRYLRPRGELLLVTGNAADIPGHHYPDELHLPDHLVFAGETHLVGLLDRAGFTVIRIERFRHYVPENLLALLTKDVVKKLVGRPTSPNPLSKYTGSFRSLWIRARLTD
ncbi:MAG: methyltransferase domain-containing protein [Anaerolineae bacterium]|nr:methyltransferase domain-containing protein [Anaerolineae bacterium]